MTRGRGRSSRGRKRAGLLGLVVKSGLVLGILVGTGACAGEPVWWLLMDFPPFHIVEHPGVPKNLVGQGVDDHIRAWLYARLTDWSITSVDVTPARRDALFKTGDQLYCAGLLLRSPERERLLYFSHPILSAPSNQVIVKKAVLPQLAPFLDPTGAIDFPALAESTDLAGAAVANRVYSPAIDRALSGSLVRRVSSDESLPHQFLLGHLDWMIGRSLEVAWEQHKIRLNSAPASAPAPAITALSIAGEPGGGQGHIGCLRTEAGRRLIDAIDRLLATGPMDQWQRELDEWANLDRS